jgi:hypothetical protein
MRTLVLSLGLLLGTALAGSLGYGFVGFQGGLQVGGGGLGVLPGNRPREERPGVGLQVAAGPFWWAPCSPGGRGFTSCPSWGLVGKAGREAAFSWTWGSGPSSSPGGRGAGSWASAGGTPFPWGFPEVAGT